MTPWACLSCDYVYQPVHGDPDLGIAPGTPFDRLPRSFKCPKCHAPRDDFEEQLTDFQDDPDQELGEEIDEEEPDAFAPVSQETELDDFDDSLPEELSEEELVMLRGLDPFTEELSGDPEEDVDEDRYDETAAFADLAENSALGLTDDIPDDEDRSNPILEQDDLSDAQGESLFDDLTDDAPEDEEDPTLADELPSMADFEEGIEEDAETDAFSPPAETSLLMQGVCSRCSFRYDPSTGCPEQGYEPGTSFDELLDDFICPSCGAALADFRLEPVSSPLTPPSQNDATSEQREPDLGSAQDPALQEFPSEPKGDD